MVCSTATHNYAFIAGGVYVYLHVIVFSTIFVVPVAAVHSMALGISFWVFGDLYSVLYVLCFVSIMRVWRWFARVYECSDLDCLLFCILRFHYTTCTAFSGGICFPDFVTAGFYRFMGFVLTYDKHLI